MRFGLALVLTALSAPAAADPQLVTLVRADRESRIGFQGSLQIYPDAEGDVYGMRTELYGQIAGRLRGGGTIGGYGQLPIGFLLGDRDEAAVGGLELGGYYVAALGRGGTDLLLRIGLSLPTAGDNLGDLITNVITSLERHLDFVNSFPETTVLKLGPTLRTPLGGSGFLQADLGVDIAIDTPSDVDVDPVFHVNLGIGGYVGSSTLLAELATTFFEDGYLGSVALGFRFGGPAHPHVAYVLVFGDDEPAFGDGVIAHIISVGFYAGF